MAEPAVPSTSRHGLRRSARFSGMPPLRIQPPSLLAPQRPFRMRFRAQQHLRRAAEIRAVREQGQRVECRAFTVWWKRRAQNAEAAIASRDAGAAREVLSNARVCVIASGAAVGDAVRRNRAKRRLRDVFRQHQDAVPRDCDLLLIARRAVIECPMLELETRFSDACRRMQAETRT